MLLFYREMEGVHIISTTTGVLHRFSHYELGQYCCFTTHRFRTYSDSTEMTGHELIGHVNNPRKLLPEVQIPAKSERSQYGRSID